ncbi:methylated-DNA--[protein]-cysteine S-methyltransferase [Candidatus Nitrosacidococcus sp. I8]|uniref:methylated-DNA--[protein]-cysteine S-methyltransferase n=1 Tax=Candidatus Nitrosacidococcus sp. I8 TaxID=2942908 RepID=UPI00222683B8|nr:methylated-DNA--[protein]-cysteine S-methyltransferase [Candidatus Nitrosacidococcus sp. I8]CAH9017762.1 Methylated-DNA--protein-cysteine methyltransferase, constitutive [Candidatus Nitrosacidococcus sp. I8]
MDIAHGYAAVLTTPLGKLGISTCETGVTGLSFLSPETPDFIATTPLAKKVSSQLQAYFINPQMDFDLPMLSEGTSFQKKVWQALRTIPSGTTLTYGALAQQLKTSPRAIGGACRSNPLPIFIPCHRIVSQQGLGGYSGSVEGPNLDIKSWLLCHEGYSIKHG